MQQIKVNNIKEYDQCLEKRGNVFHLIYEAIENWYRKNSIKEYNMKENENYIKLKKLNDIKQK